MPSPHSPRSGPAEVRPFVRRADHRAERRRSLRLVVVDWLYQVRGEALTLDVPIVLRDLSLGGLALESDKPLPKGETHLFRITDENGTAFVVAATAVHSKPAPDGVRYLSGLRFVTRAGEPPAEVKALLDRITAALSI